MQHMGMVFHKSHHMSMVFVLWKALQFAIASISCYQYQVLGQTCMVLQSASIVHVAWGVACL